MGSDKIDMESPSCDMVQRLLLELTSTAHDGRSSGER